VWDVRAGSRIESGVIEDDRQEGVIAETSENTLLKVHTDVSGSE
jgi:hypothetical protein